MTVPISSPYNLEDDMGEFPESVNSWHCGHKESSIMFLKILHHLPMIQNI